MTQLCVLPLIAWWQQQRYQSRLKSLIFMVSKLGCKYLLQPRGYCMFRKPSQKQKNMPNTTMIIRKRKKKIWQSNFQMFKRVVHQWKENKTAVISQTVLLKPPKFCCVAWSPAVLERHLLRPGPSLGAG